MPVLGPVQLGTGGGVPSTGNLYADLGSATGISINDLRESIQIQRLFERDARGGTRYPELLRSHFGVTDPMMLVHQRPVFLGGGHTMISVNPIAQTTDTLETAAGDTPQANLAAFGTIAANNHGFTYSATEHGYITGIINVRADLTYQQGLERYWSRSTRFDFFYPALGHLGEMAVLNKELYYQGVLWKMMPCSAIRKLGLTIVTSPVASRAYSDPWRLNHSTSGISLKTSQRFQPSLKAVIEDDAPIDRVVAVPAEPDFLLDVYFKIKAAASAATLRYSGMMDHF